MQTIKNRSVDISSEYKPPNEMVVNPFQQLPGYTDESIFLMTQYTALREEIQQRSGFQQQLTIGALTAAGALLPVAMQFNLPTLLFLFPILTMCLAGMWSQHAFQIERLGMFIRTSTEKTMLNSDSIKGWQSHEHICAWRGNNRIQAQLLWIAVSGVFIETQIGAVALGWFKVGLRFEKAGIMDVWLFLFDWIVIAITIVLLARSRAVKSEDEIPSELNGKRKKFKFH